MKQQTAVKTDSELAFSKQLLAYKEQIDADILQYCKELQSSTHELFGERSAVAIDAFAEILKRGGKRIRGALVLHGYAMSGGKDMRLACMAARAVEMIHAYILIIDDIQDRSATRRGGPTAHIALRDLHKKMQFGGDSAHFGISVALNAAVLGSHLAQSILATLPTDPEIRLKVVQIMNDTMVVTGHGQTNDIYNEVANGVSVEQLEQVLNWKTAQYTFVNPLQLGMTLAGESDESVASIVPYARSAGFAFQITDDIIGTFGEDEKSGKSAMDDTREGKRTLLTVYALKHADKADKNFLLTQLGNNKITPAEFKRVKEVITDSGALEFAKSEAKRYVSQSIESLAANAAPREHKQFLETLALSLLGRAI